MNGEWNQPGREPTPDELAAWADGELNAADASRVGGWLAEHPEAAHEADALRQLVRLYRDHPAPEPAEPVWQSLFRSIEAGLGTMSAGSSRWSLRFRFLAGLVATAAALLGGVVLARMFWPVRPVDPPAVAQVSEDDEPFPVALLSEVNIIRMDPQDADRIVMGVPIMSTFDLVGTEDIEIVEVEPDPEEGRMPRVRRSAGGPMIIVARTDEDDTQ
jgi:hypothetical protein